MSKAKTHREFLNEVKEKRGDEFKILGTYINAKTKILIKHNCQKCNYHEWMTLPNNILQGKGCPKCAGILKKTTEAFKKEIYNKYGVEYEVLGDYKNTNSKILIRHNNIKCNFYKWYVRPSQLLKGHGCSKCSGTNKKTTEEFKKEIYSKYKNEYIVLGEYINSQTKILMKHNCERCNYYEWEISPSNLLRGKKCPVCGGHMLKNTEKFKKEIYDKYGNEYEILGEYINSQTKIKVRHNSKKCNYYEWLTKPNNMLNNRSCPVCSNKKAVLGINTIWDTDRWMCDLGVSKEDAKKYTHGSKKKIKVKCPDCGKEKRIEICNIYNCKSISCSCGDGKSYPEKFVVNLLDQLRENYIKEYSPQWIENKRYDFYIPQLNCIIETHGEQHYTNGFYTLGGKTLKEEQANDKYKREIALANGIKYYVELDCRESNMEWIKKSILNSKLNNLFDLSNVDWNKCAEFANKNIAKEVCEYWNNKREDETTNDVGKIFNLNRGSIANYLKKGVKLGWCNYNPKEEKEKGRSKKGKNSKRVQIFKNRQSLGIFESCHELERRSEELFGIKLLKENISATCRGVKKQYKGFTFKYI